MVSSCSEYIIAAVMCDHYNIIIQQLTTGALISALTCKTMANCNNSMSDSKCYLAIYTSTSKTLIAA